MRIAPSASPQTLTGAGPYPGSQAPAQPSPAEHRPVAALPPLAALPESATERREPNIDPTPEANPSSRPLASRIAWQLGSSAFVPMERGPRVARSVAAAPQPARIDASSDAVPQRDAAPASGREALKVSLFRTSKNGSAAAAHFRGNALANAQGNTLTTLALSPALLRNPGFAALSDTDRFALLTEWFDERGLDTQYPIGTIEHAMATVLKTMPALRGRASPGPYPSERALGEAFMRAVAQWGTAGGSLVDPRVAFGLALARAQGIEIKGATLTDKLRDLTRYVKDAFAVAAEPPRFDRRRAAVAILEEKTGLPPEQLLAGGPASVVETFLRKASEGRTGYASMQFDDGPEFEPSKLLDTAEQAFDATLPSSEYMLASARMALRLAGREQTDAAVRAEAARIAQTRVTPPEKKNSSLRHWAENMPILGSIVGIGEGIANGDAEQLISAIPVIGNLYNIEEGVRTGDAGRSAGAALTLIPVVGSLYTIEEGVRQGDTARAVGGAIGLGIDIVTLGEGHAFVSRYAGERTLAPAARISAAELPPSLAPQALHTVAALEQLGIDRFELAATPAARRLAANYSVPKPVAATVDAVGEAPLAIEGRHYIVIGRDWYRVRWDADNATWRVARPDDSATAYQPPVHFVDGVWQPHGATGLPGGGYVNLETPPSRIDTAIGRLQDHIEQWNGVMTPPERLARNRNGLLARNDYPVVFRGERRSPLDILMAEGFDRSILFIGDRPLTDFGSRPLIVSAQFKGAKYFISLCGGENDHQYIYAIKAAGRDAVSLNENAHFNGKRLARYLGLEDDYFSDPQAGVDEAFRSAYAFDEVHIKGDVPIDDIYLIDTDDPQWTKRLERYLSGEPHVFGYPLSQILKDMHTGVWDARTD